MEKLKSISFSLLMLFVMASFSQCSSTKQLQEKAPMAIEQVYCQQWVAGIEGGGSGINIFIPVESKHVVLDSVYFRGRSAKLETKEGELLFVGRFKTALNQPKDMVFSNEPNAEYGNRVQIPEKIPFELKDNECVISYRDGDKTKYFKIDNVVEKEMIAYPSAPPNKQ
ncbi:MAG: hypothetical protein HKO00_06630 [Flavobacteriaceae bacterium]|nr:hypothetical protein [Flavobacteriaceae bacterium]